MANVDGFVRGETPGIFMDMFDERELDYLFEEEMVNIRRELIYFRCVLICFVILL